MIEILQVIIVGLFNRLKNLNPAEYAIILALSIASSLVIYASFSHNRKIRLVDLGAHKWLVK
jgi:hypothetical protein